MARYSTHTYTPISSLFDIGYLRIDVFILQGTMLNNHDGLDSQRLCTRFEPTWSALGVPGKPFAVP